MKECGVLKSDKYTKHQLGSKDRRSQQLRRGERRMKITKETFKRFTSEIKDCVLQGSGDEFLSTSSEEVFKVVVKERKKKREIRGGGEIEAWIPIVMFDLERNLTVLTL